MHSHSITLGNYFILNICQTLMLFYMLIYCLKNQHIGLRFRIMAFDWVKSSFFWGGGSSLLRTLTGVVFLLSKINVWTMGLIRIEIQLCPTIFRLSDIKNRRNNCCRAIIYCTDSYKRIEIDRVFELNRLFDAVGIDSNTTTCPNIEIK